MQRVTTESAGVQRLLTDCLLPPLIDAVVLIVAVGLPGGHLWQMTVAALILTPLALITLEVRRPQRPGGRATDDGGGPGDGRRARADGQRDRRDPDVQRPAHAQQAISRGVGDAAKSSASSAVWMQATANASQVFVALSTVVVLLVGIGFSSSFGLTFAGLMVFAGMVPTMFGAAQRVMGAYTTYQSVVADRGVDVRVAGHPAVGAGPPGRGRARRGPREPGLRRRGLRLHAEQKVLDGLSFSIEEGETVALVGGIGSGKSTVFNLLLRFLDPQRGRILLDGHDIGSVTIASLREQVSKLAQFPFFVKDTIRENVRLARPTASDADVEAACEQAHVHSIIVDPTKMHAGYDTVVDVQVPSGGQKRLIALARCLLRGPRCCCSTSRPRIWTRISGRG